MATSKGLLFIVCLVAAQASAQTLYKCKVDGKIVYQSMACAKGGEELSVPPPPTPAQVKAAQARVEEARQQVREASERNRRQKEEEEREEQAKPKEEANKRLAKADCDKLRARREELYGERNNNRRAANLDAMSKTQNSIDKLEAEYTKAACGPLD